MAEAALVAGSKLLVPLFQSCYQLYTSIQRSKTFAQRFRIEKRFLEGEYSIFLRLSETKIGQLAEPLDDHETERMIEIIRLLQNAKDILEGADKHIKEVAKKSQPPRKLFKKRPVVATPVAGSATENTDNRNSASDVWTLPTQSGADDGVSERGTDATEAAESQTSTPAGTSISEFGSGDTKTPEKKKKSSVRSRLSKFGSFLRPDKAKKGAHSTDPTPTASGSSTPRRSTSDAVVPSPSPDPAPPTPQTLADRVNQIADANILISVMPPKEPEVIHPDRGGGSAWVQEVKGSVEKLNEFHLAFKENNKKLARLLKLKPDAGTGLATSAASTEHASALVQQVTTTQVALQRLHQSIRCMNPAGAQKRVTLELAVNFHNEIESSRDRLDHLRLRAQGEYFYFGLKIHDRGDDLEGLEATEYVAESKINYDNSFQQAPIPPNNHKALMLNKAKSMDAEPEPGQKFMLWGDLLYEKQADYSRDIHRLFRNDAEVWTAVETLHEFMQPDGAVKHMKLWQRVELMKLAIAAQLFFTNTNSMRPTCYPITLGRFAYYMTDPKASKWDDNNPLILRPHLDIGFGRRNEGVPQYPLPPVKELGLVLLQIAGCVRMDVESSQQKEAKDWADEQFEKLTSKALMPLARIGKDCVEFEPARGAASAYMANTLVRLNDLAAFKYSQASAVGQTVP
ncbi:hypothetical protein B0T16DRAFT_197306 [Cercophora newfieldiana]|uniref:Prion-inhibition and propagation HeLo domain-containing protein n=1 Tax=Cercophora newfieldiana TaxID=92897 RepID=A0AA40CN28_9PEZI|nr:hypothetical protein B0T16DRAFT_197306 [Cercophora newfieldiana]